jgi:putative DNA primase/helicase
MPAPSKGAAHAISTLDIALSYLHAGLSIIPIKTDGTKAPPFRWKEFQADPPNEKKVRQWWRRNGEGWGIAVISGKVSGGLEVIDFDRADLFAPWCELVQAQRPGLLDRLCIVRTPSAGAHCYYRCHETTIPGNTKLALDPSSKDEKTLIETRGEGGYIVAPGSPGACHPSGRTYEHVDGPPLTAIETITAAERLVLLEAARSFDLAAAKEAGTGSEEQAAKGVRNGAGLRPGDDFDLRGPDWSEILVPHGWERGPINGGRQMWRRPGKDAPGFSATTGYCKGPNGEDLLGVFSSNAQPFDGPTGSKSCSLYGKFRAYALLNHGGDFKAAAAALRKQGYGDQEQQPNHDTPTGARDANAEARPPKLTGSKIILASFRERFQPTFRRGNVLWSGRLGREVRHSEAMTSVTTDLIDQLSRATDAPCNESGVRRDKLPAFFRSWAVVAWSDLLAELPEEEETAEVNTPAREEFRIKVSTCLKSFASLSCSIAKDGQKVGEIQRRPLLDWARQFAKRGGWKDVRGHALWSRLAGDPPALCVALHVSLFAQTKCSTGLERMSAKAFTALCELYDVGARCKVSGGDKRAVELAPEFLAELLAVPILEDEADRRTD